MSIKVLLTGATGFVGKQILNNLLQKKIDVRILVRVGKENLITKNSKVEVVTTKDLFNEEPEWIAEQCKGIDTIIHAAWYVEPNKYLDSLKNIDCLSGSINLAKGAIKSGIRRFIGIGTCFEYDLDKSLLSTSSPLKPNTQYSISKVALFTILSQLFPLYSIEFAWCRLFYLYGEGEDERRLIPYLHKKISSGQIAKLTNGDHIRDFLDVTEAGKRITEVALEDKQGPINICSGIPITIREIAEKIADKYGRRDLLKFGSRPIKSLDNKIIVGVNDISK